MLLDGADRVLTSSSSGCLADLRGQENPGPRSRRRSAAGSLAPTVGARREPAGPRSAVGHRYCRRPRSRPRSRTELARAAWSRTAGRVPCRWMLAKQHRQVGARAAEPARERARRCTAPLAASLARSRKARLALQDHAISVQHQEAVWRALDQVVERDRLRRDPARCTAPPAGQLEQEDRPVLGRHQRGPHQPGTAVPARGARSGRRLALLAHPRQHAPGTARDAARPARAAGRGRPGSPPIARIAAGLASTIWRSAARTTRTASFEASNRSAVAGFDLAQLPVVPLHRLLRGDQPGLQFGHRLEVLADGEEIGGLAQADGRVLHRQLEPAREALRHLTEAGHAGAAGVLDQLPHAAAAEIRDRLQPWPAEPAVDRLVTNRADSVAFRITPSRSSRRVTSGCAKLTFGIDRETHEGTAVDPLLMYLRIGYVECNPPSVRRRRC